jgi:MoaA/NifB/PqqE/SkfB family radical SAM enzyme
MMDEKSSHIFRTGNWRLDKENQRVMQHETTICVYPWNCLSVGSNGNLRPCCNATNPVMLEDDKLINGAPNNANLISNVNNGKDQKDVLITKTHQEIRESMLRGEQHPICNRCWEQEDQGVPSFRHDANLRHPDDYERIFEQKTTEPLVTRLELDLGTKCNLKCRMCSPFSSSLIQKEINANREHNDGEIVDYYGLHPIDKTKDFKLTEWVDFVDIKDLLKDHIHNVNYIYVIGGEPLIIDEHLELLEWIIELDLAKNMRLHYNTNGIKIGKDFIEMWKRFKSVQMATSIDGYQEHYEYVRFPAAWSKIDKNFKSIFSIPNINCSISTTVQNITLERMDEFILWAEEIGSSVFFLHVDYPNFYAPWVMPEDKYYESINKLYGIKDRISETNRLNFKYLLSRLESDGEKYFSKEYDAERNKRMRDFVNKSLVLDRIRGQNLYDFHPWAKEIDVSQGIEINEIRVQG